LSNSGAKRTVDLNRLEKLHNDALRKSLALQEQRDDEFRKSREPSFDHLLRRSSQSPK
jgi:hypothetical protein